MFRRSRKRQSRVEITFKHGHVLDRIPDKEVIEILPGQEFEKCIGADRLWEGDTVIREYDWIAGCTRIYNYFYV